MTDKTGENNRIHVKKFLVYHGKDFYYMDRVRCFVFMNEYYEIYVF